jgi:hypothetical protein
VQLPDVDEETFGALLHLLEGIENRRPHPQQGLPYHKEKLLAELAQKLRFELAASKMPSDIPAALPKGVASSVPPASNEPEIFMHWDSVLEKIDSASRVYAEGCHWDQEVEAGLQRVFYDISLRQHYLDDSFPDLSIHVEPIFRFTPPGTLTFRLHPKTSLGRRYIVSRQPK